MRADKLFANAKLGCVSLQPNDKLTVLLHKSDLIKLIASPMLGCKKTQPNLLQQHLNHAHWVAEDAIQKAKVAPKERLSLNLIQNSR